MARKSIIDAEATEIRAFAETKGLNIHPNANKQTAVQRLKTVWAEDWIEVSDAEKIGEHRPAPHQSQADDERDPSQAYYRIHIAQSEGDGVDELVQVGVEGEVMVIPRGKEVEIRAPYLEVLQHAITYQYYHEDPADIGSEILKREVPLYPVSVLGGPFFKNENGDLIAA
ncbi:MAG: hypothetical protein F4Y04_00450 [Chloroflexi bacterium]|nr:hypothetical protein [Chloroflexota bacterium]